MQSIIENYGIKMTHKVKSTVLQETFVLIFSSGILLTVFSTLKFKISFYFSVILSSKGYAQLLNIQS